MSLLDQFKQLAQSEWRHMKPGLERIYQACKNLNHPERRFRSIHIAGTNGKGSVAAMLHSVLTEAGYKVGRFTSPHLVKVNERFCIGEDQISDEELKEILIPLLAEEEGGKDLTFFELCTLIAFLYFSKNQVDIALIEVGLGGRLDSTNIITPLLSVITEISLDHTEVLGSDLASIAKEKAGIIKYKTPIVLGVQDSQIRKIIEEIAAEKEAPVYQTQIPKILLGDFFDWKKYRKLQTNLLGSHQIQNAVTALTVLELLSDKGYLIREQSIRKGLVTVQWLGRLEFSGKVLFDGAHNPSGVESVVRFLKESHGNKKWKVLFSAVQGKAVSEMLGLLTSASDEIVICRMDNSRSIDPEKVETHLNTALKISNLSAFETYQKMIQSLQIDESLLVTGSLYLIGEIKEKLMQ